MPHNPHSSRRFTYEGIIAIIAVPIAVCVVVMAVAAVFNNVAVMVVAFAIASVVIMAALLALSVLWIRSCMSRRTPSKQTFLDGHIEGLPPIRSKLNGGKVRSFVRTAQNDGHFLLMLERNQLLPDPQRPLHRKLNEPRTEDQP